MSASKKPRFDQNSPAARALVDEIVHGTFMKEGTMVAFPTCFPGASTMIPADEGHITALDITPEGIVYGGTSGRAAHLFVAMFHGVTGMVFDCGTVAGARQCVAIACGSNRFVAAVNGDDGGRLITGEPQGLPFDLIQEWGFSRAPFRDLGKLDGDPIVHAVADAARTRLIGATTRHLFLFSFNGEKVEQVGEVPGAGRLALGSAGRVYGQDGPRHLWRFDPATRRLDRQAVSLPEGVWDQTPLTWARDAFNGLLYTADAVGTIFSFDEARGFSPALGRAPLAPVGPWAVTHDGRVFGFCGAELAKLFCYDPALAKVTNLGVAVSVLERRRYGYVFGDAVTGRDGQIYFGEDDDLGHLWLYFPRISGRGTPAQPSK